MKKVKLICFDVDGTLVNGTSWWILTKGLGCSLDKATNIFEKAKKGEISFREGENLFTKIYQNTGNATKPFIQNIFENINIKPEAMDLISYLKEKDYTIYLISGAIDIYVETIAKKLNIDGFYANSSLEFDDKEILKKINYRENQAKVKLKQLQHLIKELNVNINEVIYVGDSENDIDVFKATKHGIAVCPSSEELKKNSWRVVDSLLEIKEIL